MNNSKSFFTGLASGANQGFTTSRSQEEKGLANQLMQMFMKAKIESEFSPKEYKPTTRQEALDFEMAKAGIVKPRESLAEKKTLLEIASLEQKQEGIQQKNERESDLITSTAQDNLNTIKTIKEGEKYFGPYAGLPTVATSLGGVLDYKNRKKWENNINKLLSQKVVDLITTMKSASQTGATGFGQLSEREGQLLREASTALSKDLDKETAMGYLNDMEKIYEKIISKGAGKKTAGGFVGGGNEGLVNAYMKKYPGKTREQIIKAMQRGQ